MKKKPRKIYEVSTVSTIVINGTILVAAHSAEEAEELVRSGDVDEDAVKWDEPKLLGPIDIKDTTDCKDTGEICEDDLE